MRPYWFCLIGFAWGLASGGAVAQQNDAADAWGEYDRTYAARWRQHHGAFIPAKCLIEIAERSGAVDSLRTEQGRQRFERAASVFAGLLSKTVESGEAYFVSADKARAELDDRFAAGLVTPGEYEEKNAALDEMEEGVISFVTEMLPQAPACEFDFGLKKTEIVEIARERLNSQ